MCCDTRMRFGVCHPLCPAAWPFDLLFKTFPVLDRRPSRPHPSPARHGAFLLRVRNKTVSLGRPPTRRACLPRAWPIRRAPTPRTDMHVPTQRNCQQQCFPSPPRLRCPLPAPLRYTLHALHRDSAPCNHVQPHFTVPASRTACCCLLGTNTTFDGIVYSTDRIAPPLFLFLCSKRICVVLVCVCARASFRPLRVLPGTRHNLDKTTHTRHSPRSTASTL